MKNNQNKIIHYEDIHPILEIPNFISEDLSEHLIKFLDLNDIVSDECWGAICFREYWKKRYPKRIKETPEYLQESDRQILEGINLKIYEEVQDFIGTGGARLVFSKFKGHKHITESYTPKHGFDPGVVACILVLNNNYSGGEFFIDNPSIEMGLSARSLYMFKEGANVEHGVKKILSGTRLSLVSHWQDLGSSYDWAGAPN